MKRKIYNELLKWKALKKDKMPLVLYGARQVGKTYIVTEFGKNNYQNMIYVNFEQDEKIIPYFESSISPEEIIKVLEKFYNQKIIPYETLIFFDEVQNCNRALTSLKYFAEQAPEYDIIAAGSLLGVSINREKYSFPVGKVIIKTVYPLDFEEFLWASGKELLIEKIKESFEKNKPMNETLHNEAISLYKDFLIVGGMPMVVRSYLSKDDILKYSEIQSLILSAYTADMAKYSENSQSIKTISAYESIPSQLGKENKKFQYAMIQKGARASVFGESIDWLLNAGLVLKCDKTTRGDVPPNMYVDISAFKIYMSDVGLLSYRKRITRNNLDEYNQLYRGAITENYVANQLVQNGYDLYYWETLAGSEVDFIIIRDEKIIPIEVKSSEKVRSKSLNTFIKQYKPEYSIRISEKNFGMKNDIKSVPLYAAFLI